MAEPIKAVQVTMYGNTSNASSYMFGNISFMDGNFSDDVIVDPVKTKMMDYGLPLYAQILITIAYIFVIILSIGGNSLVCYIVLAYQRMRTVTNFFIVNLACSDILMAILCIPFSFVSNMILHYWPFGKIMCPVVTYAQVVSVFLSAFTLVAISVDRYVAILYPLKPRLTSKQAIGVIATIWCLSIIVPIPIAVLSVTVNHLDHNGIDRALCVENWPDNLHKYVYSLVIMMLQYFVPLLVTVFTYARIAVVIWVKKPPGEAENNRDRRIAASKRKVRPIKRQQTS